MKNLAWRLLHSEVEKLPVGQGAAAFQGDADFDDVGEKVELENQRRELMKD